MTVWPVGPMASPTRFPMPRLSVPGRVSLLRSFCVRVCEFSFTMISPRFSFSAAGEHIGRWRNIHCCY